MGKKSYYDKYFNKRLKAFLLICVTIGILDFALAQFLNYVWAPAGLRGEGVMVQTSSTIYHHDLLPMKESIAGWGPYRYPLITNSLGFKDSSTREIILDPDESRILIIGDSFTEGVGVPFEQTFAGQIKDAFRPHGIDVLNAGVSSYSPTIYYRKIRYLLEDVGLKFDWLAVFIDISDIEDEASIYTLDDNQNVVCKPQATETLNGRHFCERPSRTVMWLKRKLRRHSIIVRFVYAIRDWLSPKDPIVSDPIERVTGKERILWTVEPDLFEAYGRSGLQQASEAMVRLNALLIDRGINLIIAVYPRTDQIMRRDLDSIQVRFFRDWAAENDAYFLNLFPWFINQQDPTSVVLKYHIPGDVHWNEAGHKLVAEVFLENAPIFLLRQDSTP